MLFPIRISVSVSVSVCGFRIPFPNSVSEFESGLIDVISGPDQRLASPPVVIAPLQSALPHRARTRPRQKVSLKLSPLEAFHPPPKITYL